MLKDKSLTIFHKEGAPVRSTDPIQGNLSNCYLISAMSALAKYPALITRLFNTKEVNEQGLYSINLCHGGVFQEVIIDDFVPCAGNKIKFARYKSGVLWPLLLEKAFAKLYGAYWQVGGGGNAVQALKDMTGAPTRYYNFSKLEKDTFLSICADVKEHNLIALTQTNREKSEVNTDKGLIEWHYYSLLGTYTVIDEEKDKEVTLIKLRNPWGKKIWEGSWSCQDTRWTNANKHSVGYKIDEFKTGTFFIEIDIFL